MVLVLKRITIQGRKLSVTFLNSNSVRYQIECLLFLSICLMHNATINILVCVEVFWVFGCWGEGFFVVVLFLVYLWLNTSKMLKRTAKVYTSISISWFPTTLSTISYNFLIFCKSEGYKVVCYSLNLHYLITNKVENILICLWITLVFHFVKCLSISFVHFSTGFSG